MHGAAAHLNDADVAEVVALVFPYLWNGGTRTREHALLQAAAYAEVMGIDALARSMRAHHVPKQRLIPAPPPRLSSRQWRRAPAALWLYRELKNGRERDAGRLARKAARQGFPPRTLKRARVILREQSGLVIYPGGRGHSDRWHLPKLLV